jgi:glycosyltransferase involved in cell wall biosynthesis
MSPSKSPSNHETGTVEGLAICYTAFNSMRTIKRSLESALALSDHVVVVDSGSTDGTIDLCRDHGIETIHRDWTNPTEQKAFAMSFCKERPWVLLLDSDETVLEDLAPAIRKAIEEAGPEDTGFEMNRRTWFDGRPLRHAFQPEWRLRLVQTSRARILADPSGVHDRLEVDGGRVGRLTGILRHDSWEDAADMLRRGVSWGVQTGRAAEKGGRVVNLVFNPGFAFLKQLLIRRAILDGWRGWVAAAGVASQTLAKHIAIMERRERERESSRSS